MEEREIIKEAFNPCPPLSLPQLRPLEAIVQVYPHMTMFYPRVGECRKSPIKLWLGLIMEQGIRLKSELIRTGTDGVWKNINGSRYNLKTRTFFQRIIVQPIHISSEVKKHSFRIECEIPRTICRIEITSVPVNLTKIWELQQQKHF